MVSTRHCCWGECKTDSRYPDKWPNSLKELQQSGKKVFIPFPKPSQDIEKCKRWLVACSRQFFTEEKISRNTYICALHWPGGKGPTAETPDPLKANLTPQQATRACAPKRKAPKPVYGQIVPWSDRSKSFRSRVKSDRSTKKSDRSTI